MHNELLHIGPVTIYGYGLMIALGIIAALTIAEIRAKKIGLNTDALYYLTFVCAVTGFLGAKGLFVLVEFESFLDNPAMVLSGNGFVVYGGIICREKRQRKSAQLSARTKSRLQMPYTESEKSLEVCSSNLSPNDTACRIR